MKKVVLLFTVLTVALTKADAMSYEQARDQALFLTDKMAYELNLTPEQYDAAYEVNLDYLMGVTTADDVYGTYWEHRNLDLGYILLDWQYRAFVDCLWFYRPLYWDAGFWHFRIYGRYPHRDWFYFEQRTIVVTYRGGHCWSRHGGSWYCGRTFGHPGRIGTTGGCGMRNNWNGHGHKYGSAGSSNRNHSGSFTRSDGTAGRTGGRIGQNPTNTGNHRTDGNIGGRGSSETPRGIGTSGQVSGGHSGSFSATKSTDGNNSRTFYRNFQNSNTENSYGRRSSNSSTGNSYNRSSGTHSYSTPSNSFNRYGNGSAGSFNRSSSETRSYSGSSFSGSRSTGSRGSFSGGGHSGFSGGHGGSFSGGHSGGHFGGGHR